MHSVLLVTSPGGRLMVDCGLDWLGRVAEIAPDAIAITHAHPDHAWGLKEGAPCPVYATEDAWRALDDYPLDRHTLLPRRPESVAGVTIEAFTVDHSLLAPAVGLRIGDGETAIFYSPDVVYVHERSEALGGVSLYIGDGASVTRSMVRRRGSELFGHAPIRTQLTWCQKEGVPCAIFTHCGSEIVGADDRDADARVAALAADRGVAAAIACDGMEMAPRPAELGVG